MDPQLTPQDRIQALQVECGGGGSTMEAVYPRRVPPRSRRAPRLRHRTMPVTFAEIKEVDEENDLEEEAAAVVTCEQSGGSVESARQARDELERRFAASRRRRRRPTPDDREYCTSSSLVPSTATQPTMS